MTRIEDVGPEEEGRRWGQQEYIDAMQYFQGTEFFPLDRPTLGAKTDG